MLKQLLYGFLDHPFWYRLAQNVFAPGADHLLVKDLRHRTAELPMLGPIVDIGCGPASWLSKVGFNPVGLDICHPYSIAYHNNGGLAITGSAMSLPIPDQTCNAVWSIGVLHHLPDDSARLAVGEMVRVCRKGGVVALLDAVMPRSPWLRPLAYGVRKLDRGAFMRAQSELEALLVNRERWTVSRFTYSYNGLEMFMALSRCR